MELRESASLRYFFFINLGTFFINLCINPLVTDPLHLARMAKISISKTEGIIEKIPYERRAYESVGDRSHSLVISQKKKKKKSTKNKTQAIMG